MSRRAALLTARRSLRYRRRPGGKQGRDNGGGSENDALNSIFSRADTSGDGILSRSEYEAFMSFEKLRGAADSAGVTQDVFMKILAPSSRRGASASGSLATTVAEQTASAAGSTAIQPKQYALMSLKSGLPFVAFGFVDNAIMIMAGDMIEASIGATLALSTMAAAGIGNMFSDVIGIAATDAIEQVCEKLGLPSANLTAAQLLSQGARTCHVLSQAVGIAIGCILGLAPLLFLDQEEKMLRNCFDEADVDGDGELTAQVSV